MAGPAISRTPGPPVAPDIGRRTSNPFAYRDLLKQTSHPKGSADEPCTHPQGGAKDSPQDPKMTQKGVHKPEKSPPPAFFPLPDAVPTPAFPRAEGSDGCQARRAKAGVAVPAAGGGGDGTAGRPTLRSDGAQAPRGEKHSHPSSPSRPDPAVQSRELPCPAGASRRAGRPLPGSMTPADASASAASSSCGWWRRAEA